MSNEENQSTVHELPESNMREALSWFIGSGIDDETLLALEEDDKLQKEHTG